MTLLLSMGKSLLWEGREAVRAAGLGGTGLGLAGEAVACLPAEPCLPVAPGPSRVKFLLLVKSVQIDRHQP